MNKGDFFNQHLERVHAALDPASQIQNVSDYMTRYTMLGNKPFNFDKFKFQKIILDHPARKKVVRKPSQCGVSEFWTREAVCFCLLHAGKNAMMVMPTASSATKQSATRLSPIIDGSPHVAGNIHKLTDSNTVKRFINNSFFFFQGASGAGLTISIPVDALYLDELDYASQEITSGFTSRLGASDFKWERAYSTPTSTGVGISESFQDTKRHWPVHTCERCNNKWIIDYYRDVRLPKFKKSLSDITFNSKAELIKYDIHRAYVECPKCHRSTTTYEWEFVCENPDDNYDGVGFQVTPFIIPDVRPPSSLISDSTKFSSSRRFINDSLGIPAEDSTTGLTAEEVRAAFTSDARWPDSPAHQFAGLDMGGQCALLTAQGNTHGDIRVMHAELIPLSTIHSRIPQIFAKNKVVASVMDSQPYPDTAMQLQSNIRSLWAATFVESKTLDLFQVREKEEDINKATFSLRQVHIKKNQGLDLLCNLIRSGKLTFAPSTFDMRETIIRHTTDMRRLTLKGFGQSEEEEVRWRKSSRAEDHLFHSLLYLVIASYMVGISTPTPPISMIASKFKVTASV